ncbi:hypothetical protein SS50377_24519 [Spironucleus salmonicida]|uniref:Uncharacterized protein n=1 Tax=Spironucleus salmonicida TaxID=348837 RepID=V6LNW8_9EUKA|nr:hypothetical protein SS50377_24519 [Spironucleus salmonicida]|eukprot:EST45938.1 Hypothetical protein SS50377_13917 [Spironucleus salmonicida]
MLCTQIALNLTHHFVLSNRCLAVKYQNNILSTFCSSKLSNFPPQMGFEFSCKGSGQVVISDGRKVAFFDPHSLFIFDVSSRKLTVRRIPGILNLGLAHNETFLVLAKRGVLRVRWQGWHPIAKWTPASSAADYFFVSRGALHFAGHEVLAVEVADAGPIAHVLRVQEHMYLVQYEQNALLLDFERRLRYAIDGRARNLEQLVAFSAGKLRTQQHARFSQNLYSLNHFFESQLLLPRLPAPEMLRVRQVGAAPFRRYFAGALATALLALAL